MEIIIGIIAYLVVSYLIMMVIISIVSGIKAYRVAPVERKNDKKQIIEQVKENEKISKWGPVNPAYICPHCQTKGFVRTKPVKRKKGVSGAKVTGALFTLGASILVTGLSRKEDMTQAHCENCNSTWDF